MSGYPHHDPHGYGYGSSYGAPPPARPPYAQPYGAPNQPSQSPYGAPNQSSQSPYGAAPNQPSHSPYDPSNHPSHSPYGAPSHSPYAPSAPQPPKPEKPPKDDSHQPYGASSAVHVSHAQYGEPPSAPPPTYGSPFASLVPSSAFPPGTDPNVMACFQMADQDGSGTIDDKELQRALSSYNQSFSLRTVHLLMNHFTNGNSRRIGRNEFVSLFYGLQNWRSIFERFDRDRSGKIDASELREALLSIGFAVPPVVLDLLVCKFDKTGGKNKAIEYDHFIECCLTVQGLTEKFKAKDKNYSGSATFTYEDFMVTVLPFLVA